MIQKLTLSAGLLALSCVVGAEDIRWNGFASVTAGITFDDDEQLYGYDDSLAFKPETLVALQAQKDLSQGLSLTVQLLGQGDEDFDLAFEWAFIGYDISDNVHVNVGRIRTPFFLYSDYLDVGYAYHWKRPPESVYDSSFNTIEGANLQFQNELGDASSLLEVLAGRSTRTLNFGGAPAESELTNLVGFAWTVEYDWLTARTAYFQAELNFDIESEDINQLTQTLDAVGFSSVSDNILVQDDTGTFFGLALKAEYDDLLVVMEYTDITIDDNMLPNQESWYISAGYTFGDFLAHITFEGQEDPAKTGVADAIPAGTPTTDFLIATVDGITGSLADENDTVTVGLRYNFHPSAALKADYSMRDNDLSGHEDNVFTVGVDVIF